MAPVTSLPTPQTKADWAYAMLVAMGIDPRNNPNSVAALVAQQNEEGTTAQLWNNPLAVTVSYTGSKNDGPQNSAGVLKFSSWQDGVEANALFMEKNDPQLISVLAANATPAQYGQALENADWEALGGSKSAANVSYGKAVAAASSNGGGLSAEYQKVDPTGLIGQALGKLKSAAGDVGGAALNAATGGIAGIIGGGIASWLGISNISWKQVGGFILGLAFIAIGIYVMFHTQIDAAVEKGVGTTAGAAAKAAAA